MKLSYISLFSGAGIGCYKLNDLGFKCIATIEKEYKRLLIQKTNKKCENESGYICSDLSLDSTKQAIYDIVNKRLGNDSLTLLVATPPCQGMSVANHKKNNEKKRNSLIVDSVKITKYLLPNFFIFENVSSFLNTICFDGYKDITISELIYNYLDEDYFIYSKVLNFKNYGANSSRTRTLVIGSKKKLNISPLNLFPNYTKEKTLYEVIGYLKSLKIMGEIDNEDIFHQFRKYDIKMLDWIKDIKEGQSAFDNEENNKRPHKVINSIIVENTNKNGDKYKRQYWDKVGPCIHTRNDILSSQNTIHPTDNRVFSIRELMELMNIPKTFRWSSDDLNKLTLTEKELFLKQNELNIRKCIGEAVPSVIFEEISKNIIFELNKKYLYKKDINRILNNDYVSFIKENYKKLHFDDIVKIVELSKNDRKLNASFFTPQYICFDMIKDLPDFSNKDVIRILEPSCGIGSFLPQLIKKYQGKKLEIDCIDIDIENISIAKNIFINTNDITFNFINADFLLYDINKKYDIVVGNPPFGNIIKDKKLLREYKKISSLNNTNNIFAFFVEKVLNIAEFVFFITPKSILSAPEFTDLRKLLNNKKILIIKDYGEKAFDIKIETISFLVENKKSNNSSKTIIYYHNKKREIKYQYYITENIFDIWLLYRDSFFDSIYKKMEFKVFTVFRDRQITKKILKDSGKYRVLKSRNIINNGIINIPKYDKFIDDVSNLSVGKFLNLNRQIILIPNLTYYPRATILPNDCIADGSVAILTADRYIDSKDLDYFSSEEFYKFYKIARNYSTRTMNIDSNSVKFFGILKNKYKN